MSSKQIQVTNGTLLLYSICKNKRKISNYPMITFIFSTENEVISFKKSIITVK